MSQMICVAGNLGSGKSTLAAGLANAFGWAVVPPANVKRTSYDVTYLRDLFCDPSRWSFEAQMAFLHEKAESISAALRRSPGCVVDRGIDEDINIFAKLFYDNESMDERAYATYKKASKIIMEKIPNPIFLIYCRCSANVCKQRLAGRDRPYQALYPANHVEMLEVRYEEWFSKFEICPKGVVDSEQLDSRSSNTLRKIIDDICDGLADAAGAASTQMSLFAEARPIRRVAPGYRVLTEVTTRRSGGFPVAAELLSVRPERS